MKDPDKNTIHTTFDGTNRYVAPVYQRFYVWGYEELQALLDDIENAADKTSIQFIGATVLQDMGKKGGTQSPNDYLIVDGQQRLTTIYLLICAIAKSYLRANKIDDALSLIETYLSCSAGKYRGMPKLLPTVQDRQQLYTILEEDIGTIKWNFGSDSADTSSRRKGIKVQWNNIMKHFDENVYNSRGRLIPKRLEKFKDNLLNYIEYIQVTLELEDDANTAFSKLNYQGIPLSISDLVRNDVFSRLDSDEQAADKFYNDVWSPFEKSFPKDSFDQYITTFSTIKFKGKVTKARAFPELQKSWSSKKPAAIVNDLKIYSDLYSSLVEYKAVPGFHKEINEMIRRFSYMPKTTVTWPYVLELLNATRNRKASKKQVVDGLSVVESFLVRRAIVGLEPTGLHAVFKGLWNKAGPDISKLKDSIVTTTIKFPTDVMVKEALKHENMHKRQITKYILIQRELLFNKKKGYDNAIENFSVEHVMPRNRIGIWAKDFTPSKHREYLNCIGNLFPLTKKQNSDIKDLDWDKKKLRFKGSNWKITQKLCNLEKWDEAQIKRQTKEFSKWIFTEWPDIS